MPTIFDSSTASADFSPAGAGWGPVVLIVDDRAENIAAFGAVLDPLTAQLGCRLVTAQSADEALRHVLTAGDTLAVVLMDVMMPGTDGIETARLIRQRTRSEHVPIIFVTALDVDRRRVTLGYQSGAVDYLTKPVDPAVLRGKVRSFVDLHRRRLEAAIAERRRFADLVAAAERAAAVTVQATEARLARVRASLPDAVQVFDAEWRWTYVNAAAELLLAQLGVDATDLVGRVLWDTLPELVGTRFEAEARHAVATGYEATYEEYVEALDGWLEQRLVPGPDGSVTTFSRDITERHRAAERARFLADASELLADAALDSTATLDALVRHAVPFLADYASVDVVADDGTVRRVACAHRDPARTALVRETWERYPYPPAADVGAPRVLRTGEPQLTAAMPWSAVSRFAADESHRALLGALSPQSYICVPLAHGAAPLGTLSLVRASAEAGGSGRAYTAADLAVAEELGRRAGATLDNARLYRAAERARAAAEEANAAKTQFLRVISHEYRTPLGAILGIMDLYDLGIRGPVLPQQAEDFGRVRRNARVLLALVNDVLNFTRLEAGQVELVIDDVRLDLALCDLEDVVGPHLAAKQLAYDNGRAREPLVVRADGEKLRIVLQNLLTNAIKFTAPGGRITVACEEDAAAGLVRVRVSDTGRGIPGDKLDDVFQPFVQVDRHLTHQSQQGVGLGLAISRELARRMGGELSAESEVGVGSTFTFTVVRAGREAASAER
jgi:PAS domain S-box-containing protein